MDLIRTPCVNLNCKPIEADMPVIGTFRRYNKVDNEIILVLPEYQGKEAYLPAASVISSTRIRKRTAFRPLRGSRCWMVRAVCNSQLILDTPSGIDSQRLMWEYVLRKKIYNSLCYVTGHDRVQVESIWNMLHEGCKESTKCLCFEYAEKKIIPDAIPPYLIDSMNKELSKNFVIGSIYGIIEFLCVSIDAVDVIKDTFKQAKNISPSITINCFERCNVSRLPLDVFDLSGANNMNLNYPHRGYYKIALSDSDRKIINFEEQKRVLIACDSEMKHYLDTLTDVTYIYNMRLYVPQSEQEDVSCEGTDYGPSDSSSDELE